MNPSHSNDRPGPDGDDSAQLHKDPLEQALETQQIGTIRHEPFASIPADMLVRDAVKKLAELHVACLPVAENNRLVGIFSERDVLSKVALEYDALQNRPVGEVMTDDPIYVLETDSAIAALSVMAMCGYRHVPVVDLNDNLVGIVSPQRLTEFLQQYFQPE